VSGAQPAGCLDAVHSSHAHVHEHELRVHRVHQFQRILATGGFPGFAKQLGAPKFTGVVMGLLSRKVRRQARKLGVSYSFLFMHANGGQLRELASLYDAGHLRPLIDKTFPFNQTLEALAYVEQGRANGKVVITLD
jgi:NADPH:quinone reductase-like Zn-dependent oxidoreductase